MGLRAFGGEFPAGRGGLGGGVVEGGGRERRASAAASCLTRGGGVGGTAGERGGDSISLGVRRAEEAKGRGRWGGEVGIGVPEEEGGEEGRDFDCVCRRFANSWRTGEGRGRSS